MIKYLFSSAFLIKLPSLKVSPSLHLLGSFLPLLPIILGFATYEHTHAPILLPFEPSLSPRPPIVNVYTSQPRDLGDASTSLVKK